VTAFAEALTVAAADAVPLHLRRRSGAGVAALLAHGITGHWETWAGLMHAMPDDWDVIAADARGHGESGRSPAYRYQQLSGDVARICTQLGLVAPALIGHSMGAATIAACAADNPDLPSCIVLEDPPWRQVEPTVAEQNKRATVWRQELEVQQRGTIEERISVLEEVRPGWSPSQRRQCAAAEQATDPAVIGLVGAGTPHWRSTVAAIACPVLLICGDPVRGAIVTPEAAAEVQRINRLVEVVTLSAGHTIHSDASTDYTQAVIGFVRRHGQTQSAAAR
jgi:N-formylmaleamate deformylase